MNAGGAAPSSGPVSRWLSRRRESIAYRLRHLAGLLARAYNSVQSRGVGPTLRMARSRLFPPSHRLPLLQLYKDIPAEQEVRLSPVADPVASIVIPVHGQLDYTRRCLHALARSGDRTPFEVIVVDDASADASASVLPAIEGLRYQRNPTNLGFVASCNAGAALARGRYLVMLNNDTIAQPGWLDALLQTFATHPDTGVAGSKLVYPDGRLQEAGAVVFADGSAANIGRFEDPRDPRYNFVREVDYCSGAAIAVPRALFEQLGGFDAHYAPAYYEDTDLAMRVRQCGLKVRYQPASVVVHFEGASAGTDLRAGMKSYQVVNARKFRERWAAVLAAQHPPAPRPGADSGDVATHRARRRVLVIDAHTPTPDRDSGSVRLVALMRLLIAEGCHVVFVNQKLSDDGDETAALRQLGVEAWSQPWMGGLPAWLRDHGSRFDAIIVCRHYVLAPLLSLLRRHAPRAEIVFDTVDLHFLREQREAAHSGDAAAGRAAVRSRANELALIDAVDATWVVSPVEQALLADLAPRARVAVVSNIHEQRSDTPGFSGRRDLLFVGSFRHPPNVDAARWMASEILPRIRDALPSVRLQLVGADAPASVLALQLQEGVDVRGHVADLDALLDATRISVAPLRFGAGIKGKVNQSLARGLPVVATTCAIEGMGLADGSDVLCADSADAFADAILRLYDDAVLWQRLRERGYANISRHFSPEVALAVIRPWLQGLR